MERTKEKKKSTNNTTNNTTNNLPLREAYRILSRRESEVLFELTGGKTNQQIASELFVTAKTVENHITNIGNKLKMKGRGALRKWAVNEGKKMG